MTMEWKKLLAPLPGSVDQELLLRNETHIGWYKQGLAPEEITTEIPHLSLAQVYAALTYYHANRDEIEADIAEEDLEATHLETQHALRRHVL